MVQKNDFPLQPFPTSLELHAVVVAFVLVCKYVNSPLKHWSQQFSKCV